MPTITIDNCEYDVDNLSQEAKEQLEMLVACDTKLRELQRDGAITQTARNAYAGTLKGLLPTPMEQVLAQGETMKFS